MATPKFSSPFPRLDLTLEDKKELCRISKSLVDEVTECYERFLWNDNAQLNPARWALVKEREDVRVYHDRLANVRTDRRELNVLMTVGTLTGSLDDAMYSMLNHTTASMRVKTAYVKDTIVNCAVLTTIQEPTTDKPFRSMTVKWGVKALPLHIRALVKNRDLVYVESMGMKTLANGETIGFQLLHSIDFKHTQPLPQFTRANISICSIWRQKTPEKTQVFMKSFIDVPDRLLAPVVLRSSAEALISVSRFMHVAQMKKLAWLMKKVKRRISVADEEKNALAAMIEAGCAVCGSQSSTSRQGAKSCCTICGRSVCASCRVRRELCYIAPDNQLVERRTAFCVPCISVAAKANAVDVVRDEIASAKGDSLGISELLKLPSITRFSYSGRDSSHRDTRRRSMTLVAPLKPPAPSYGSSAPPSSSSKQSLARSPSMTPTPSGSSWLRR